MQKLQEGLPTSTDRVAELRRGMGVINPQDAISEECMSRLARRFNVFWLVFRADAEPDAKPVWRPCGPPPIQDCDARVLVVWESGAEGTGELPAWGGRADGLGSATAPAADVRLWDAAHPQLACEDGGPSPVACQPVWVMKYYIQCIGSAHQDETVSLPHAGELVIGRGPSSGLKCHGKQVSERHCTIRIRRGTHRGEGPTVELVDSSTNGTFVGARRLAKGTSSLLEDGARFALAEPLEANRALQYVFALHIERCPPQNRPHVTATPRVFCAADAPLLSLSGGAFMSPSRNWQLMA